MVSTHTHTHTHVHTRAHTHIHTQALTERHRMVEADESYVAHRLLGKVSWHNLLSEKWNKVIFKRIYQFVPKIFKQHTHTKVVLRKTCNRKYG